MVLLATYHSFCQFLVNHRRFFIFTVNFSVCSLWGFVKYPPEGFNNPLHRVFFPTRGVCFPQWDSFVPTRGFRFPKWGLFVPTRGFSFLQRGSLLFCESASSVGSFLFARKLVAPTPYTFNWRQVRRTRKWPFVWPVPYIIRKRWQVSLVNFQKLIVKRINKPWSLPARFEHTRWIVSHEDHSPPFHCLVDQWWAFCTIGFHRSRRVTRDQLSILILHYITYISMT